MFVLIAFLLLGCADPTFDETHADRTVKVDRGDSFFIILKASDNEWPRARQFTRMKPALVGGSIRYVGRDKDDGKDRFEFEAMGPGEATVSFARSFDKNLPPPRNGQVVYPKREVDYRITVRVRR